MGNTLRSVQVKQVSQLPNFTVVYSVPSNALFTVSMLHFCNTSSSDLQIRACLTQTGESATEINAIIWDFTIATGDVLEIFKGDIWLSGSSLQISSSNIGLTVKLSGIETS
jgi:hypothetical protein